MPNSVQTMASTTVAVANAAPATIDSAGFGALTWVVVAEVTDIPEFGKAFNLVTHAPIAGRAIQKFKGSSNSGSVAMTMARDDDDLGQIDLKAALALDVVSSFRITYQDAAIDYFTAQVMAFTSTGGGVDSIVTRTLQLEIVSDIVTV